jgi:hypothetical protein
MNQLVAIETVDQALVMVDRAYQALVEAVEFQGVRQVRNLAVAAAAYAREANDTRLLDRAQELRTRAEHKGGQMLDASAKAGQRATEKGNVNPGTKKKVSNSSTPSPVTLAQIGITRDQASKWQQLAALPDDKFEEALVLTKEVAHEVSAAKVLRVVQEQSRKRGPEIVADDDTVVEPPPPRVLTPDEQAIAFYNAVRDLGRLTLNATELRAAVPYYQHERITTNINVAIAVLRQVQTTWTKNAA